MKKLWIILLVLATLLTGCGNNGNADENGEGTDVQQKEETPKEPDYTLADFMGKTVDEVVNMVSGLDYIEVANIDEDYVDLVINGTWVTLSTDQNGNAAMVWMDLKETDAELNVIGNLTTYMNGLQAEEILTQAGFTCEYKYPYWSDNYTTTMLWAISDNMKIQFEWHSNDFTKEDINSRPATLRMVSKSAMDWIY